MKRLRCAWLALGLGLGLALALLSAAATAGVMTREALQQAFPSPLQVGERDPALPVWPIFRRELTSTVLMGYVFESVDFAPVPGFSGTPVNLLVGLDAKGAFFDVKVLSQHEPVFVEGLGEAPLFRFAEQYKGLSLKQNIKIGSNQNRSARDGSSANVFIDGVAKATASVRIVNQSLLSSALKVARAKLGFAAGRDPDRVGRVRTDVFAPMDWPALEKAGLIARLRLNQRDVETAFRGSIGEGLDEAALREPNGLFTELFVAPLDLPSVGRNLLPPKAWAYLQGWLEPGDHAFLVASRGRYGFVGDDFVTGAVPDRLTLRQGGLPVEIRDLDVDARLALPEPLKDLRWRVFKVISASALDPSAPMDFALSVVRSKGTLYPERVRREFGLTLQLPAAYVSAPQRDEKTWHSLWAGRAGELAVLVAALALLSVALARPAWLVATPRRLALFRNGFLVFTLVFIGWFAQGQLSIVNLTAAIQALQAGRSLDFFLYDPMTVLLWAFTAITLVVWGRATFCGWLCPFGALQDLVSQAAAKLGLKRLRLHRRVDARLKGLKYAVLAVIVATAFTSGPWTDRVVELEPFKTAITLVFARHWPFVLWAAALVLASAWLYKGYCRYLCPLGAGLALLGRLRRLPWIARRAECGTPCQSCRHACEYQAIRPSGAIDYAECFQCLECVAIHDSPQRCAPLIVQGRAGRRAFPVPVVAALPHGVAS